MQIIYGNKIPPDEDLSNGLLSLYYSAFAQNNVGAAHLNHSYNLST